LILHKKEEIACVSYRYKKLTATRKYKQCLEKILARKYI